MRRDELIEELKRCPYDGDVIVNITVNSDYFNQGESVRRGGDLSCELPIKSVSIIPSLKIICGLE